jgi:hypothetical protein
VWQQGHYSDGYNLMLRHRIRKIEFVSGRWIALRIDNSTARFLQHSGQNNIVKDSLCIYDIQNPHANGFTLSRSYDCYQLCYSDTNDNRLMFYAIDVNDQYTVNAHRYKVLPGGIEVSERKDGNGMNMSHDTIDIWRTIAVSYDAFIVASLFHPLILCEQGYTKYTICRDISNPMPWISNHIIDIEGDRLYSRELSETRNKKLLCRYSSKSLPLGMILRRFWITYNASVSIYDTLEEQTSSVPAISKGTSQTLAANILGIMMLQNEQLVFCDISELVKCHNYKGKTQSIQESVLT